MKNWATAVLVGSLLLAPGGELSASETVTMSLDATLVDADAIVLASVASISQAEDDVAVIALKPIRTIENRWGAASVLSKIQVRGTVSDSEGAASVRFDRDLPAIQRGRTYVFILRGGASSRGPFVDASFALMPVSEKGDSVECGSGRIYGVTRDAVACGRPETTYGAPMKVAELCDALEKQLARSKEMRPGRRQRRIGELQPMTLRPKGKGAP
jgi:hypothetical protein